MSRYRLVAAEKAAARPVLRACVVLEVSRSAYYQWAQQMPSARARQDAMLDERITRIHRESAAPTARRGSTTSSDARESPVAASGSRV